MCLLTCMPIFKQYALCWELLLIIFITITIRLFLIRLHGLPAYVCPGLHLHMLMLGSATLFMRMTGLLSLTMSAENAIVTSMQMLMLCPSKSQSSFSLPAGDFLTCSIGRWCWWTRGGVAPPPPWAAWLTTTHKPLLMTMRSYERD